jgi:ATP-dependent RNA helicase DeaD
VINYDMPRDSEAYVHRIGRTGRAGRAGCSILYITPREQGFATTIQRATRQPLVPMEIPTAEQINAKRVASLQKRVQVALNSPTFNQWSDITARLISELEQPIERLTTALVSLAMGDLGLMPPDSYRSRTRSGNPTFTEDTSPRKNRDKADRPRPVHETGDMPRNAVPGSAAPRTADTGNDDLSELISSIRSEQPRGDKRGGQGMVRYRMAVGRLHGVLPTHLVGAIANETGLNGRDIGRIDIEDDHSFVDLPEGMPSELFSALRKTWVMGQPLGISKADDSAGDSRSMGHKRPGKKPNGKKPFGAKPKNGRSQGDKPFGGKSFGGKPYAGKGGANKPGGTAVAMKAKSKPKAKKRPKKDE